MPATVVPFSSDHILAALKLWAESPGVRLNDADTPEGLQLFLERNPGLSVAAMEGEALVATLLCGHDGRRGYLQHMAVAETHRRQGLGSAMVKHVLAALQKLNIHKCHVFVVKANPFGELFWQQLGWEQREDIHIFSGSTEPESAAPLPPAPLQ